MNQGRFILSHLAVLGAGWAIASQVIGAGSSGNHTGNDPLSSERSQVTDQDAVRMARSFLKEKHSPVDRAAHLKTLDPLEEGHLEKLEELMKLLPDDYLVATASSPTRSEYVAEFEGRLLEWFNIDQAAAVDWLISKHRAPFREDHPTFMEVLIDYADSRGLHDNFGWMRNLPESAFSKALGNRVKQLGLRPVLEMHPNLLFTRQGQQVIDFIPFSERDLVLGNLTGGVGGNPNRFRVSLGRFIGNSEHPREETFQWLRRLRDEETIPENYRAAFAQVFKEWLQTEPGISVEERAATIRDLGLANKGYYNEDTSAESLTERIGFNDVRQLLREGRDWRYEYGQGRVDGEEIWENLRQQLPGMTAESEKGAQISLFRHLAEHDFTRAASLLEDIPEEERRDLIYRTTWYGFINVDPARLLAFSQSVPPPETEAEKAQLLKGWDWRARFFIQRHGDDYVDWVQTIPEGPERAEAMESVIWSTGEINRQRGAELRKLLTQPTNPEQVTE